MEPAPYPYQVRFAARRHFDANPPNPVDELARALVPDGNPLEITKVRVVVKRLLESYDVTPKAGS